MTREHINPMQWHQSVGFARQACARVFRDGGTARDAVSTFGLAPDHIEPADWDKAVDAIAEVLCHQPMQQAA